jgi:hypothetical protein
MYTPPLALAIGTKLEFQLLKISKNLSLSHCHNLALSCATCHMRRPLNVILCSLVAPLQTSQSQPHLGFTLESIFSI